MCYFANTYYITVRSMVFTVVFIVTGVLVVMAAIIVGSTVAGAVVLHSYTF